MAMAAGQVIGLLLMIAAPVGLLVVLWRNGERAWVAKAAVAFFFTLVLLNVALSLAKQASFEAEMGRFEACVALQQEHSITGLTQFVRPDCAAR